MKGLRPFSIRLLCFLLAVAATVAAQESQPSPSSVPDEAHAAQPATATPAGPERPALEHRYPRYKLQPDDGIVITFPLTPEFDQPSHCLQTTTCSVMVQPDGYINLEGAGSIYVKGMTVPEVVEAVKKAYSGVLHDPIIHIDLIEFQKPYFLVSGQVGKPGQYDLRHDTTASEAIAIAGGFAPTAKTQVFLFHRVSSGWVEVRKLNLKEILNGKNVNEDTQLSSGDMLFVPEKFITNFRKYVPYSLSATAGSYIVPN